MRDTIYCVTCVLVTLVLVALCGRFVTHIWLLAFLESLQTHFAVASTIGALLAIAVRRHWYAVALLFAAVSMTGYSVLLLQAHSTELASGNRTTYRLLSFNIDNDNFENGDRIADLISASKADVVEIFEAMPVEPRLARLAGLYPYRIGCGVLTSACDSLILSRRPFLSQSIASLSMIWPNRIIKAVVDMDGQPVALVSAHLSKPYFDEFHQDELYWLTKHIEAMKEPLLLAGDFNAAVLEPDMQAFLENTGLKHVFPEPATWPIRAGPFGIAIDHVFARAPLQLKSVTRVPDAMGSNHYGLMTEFTIAR